MRPPASVILASFNLLAEGSNPSTLTQTLEQISWAIAPVRGRQPRAHAGAHRDFYGALMRTTVDLPDAVHKRAMALARDTSRSFSQTVSDLVRRGLEPGQPQETAR